MTQIPRSLDQVTWGDISVWLAQGAVSWAAGQILNELFGKKLSFDSLIQQIVEQVRVVVRQEIRAEFLRDVTSEIRTAQDEIRAYLLAPEGKDRLISATGRIQGAINRLDDFEVSGYRASIVARSLQLAIVSERVKVISGAERRVLLDHAVQAVEYYNRMTVENYSREFEFEGRLNLEINPYFEDRFSNWGSFNNCPYSIWRSEEQIEVGGRESAIFYSLRENGRWIVDKGSRRALRYRSLEEAKEKFYQLARENWQVNTHPAQISASIPSKLEWSRAVELLK